MYFYYASESNLLPLFCILYNLLSNPAFPENFGIFTAPLQFNTIITRRIATMTTTHPRTIPAIAPDDRPDELSEPEPEIKKVNGGTKLIFTIRTFSVRQFSYQHELTISL